MTLPGLVAARNLADVADKEKAWDSLGLNISANITTPESLAYIAAVEAADGAFLEEEVKAAIHAFVVGCKLDGIWPAIKTSCILAGARTLNGALVPLAGAAPTNFNFVAGDYNRKTGLVGDGSTKYLDSNRPQNSESTTDLHTSVFCNTAATAGSVYLGAGGGGNPTYRILSDNSVIGFGVPNITISYSATTTGFIGIRKNNAVGFIGRANATTLTATGTWSGNFDNINSAIFARLTTFTGPASPSAFTDARLAFYSIGESLDLALLDARVTALINAIAAAIP